MTALNPTAAKLTRRHPPLFGSLNPHRPFFSKPSSSSLSLRFPPPPLPQFFLSSPVKASLQNPNHENPYKKPAKPFNCQVTDKSTTPVVSLIPFLAPLRATAITAVTAAALIFSGFCFPLKPSVAAPLSPPPTVESADKDPVFSEKSTEEHLVSNPNDVDELKNLLESEIKSKDIAKAIETINKLMELQPDEVEWPLMRAHMYARLGKVKLAKDGFNELLKKDPCRVEAYHGLVTIASEDGPSKDLENIETRIEEAMKLCKKKNKNEEMRDFKLLLAQLKVLKSKYDEALKVYQELVKEEPRDFRPYLCQGIIYTLMRKDNEAEKNFEKYRRLVPKGHPYASYFDENLMATKLFAQKVENERAMAKS